MNHIYLYCKVPGSECLRTAEVPTYAWKGERTIESLKLAGDKQTSTAHF
jgi:hypothetical protein